MGGRRPRGHPGRPGLKLSITSGKTRGFCSRARRSFEWRVSCRSRGLRPIQIWRRTTLGSLRRAACSSGTRPFPIDLSLVGPRDEEYWDRYRTTPKAFLPLEAGQALWESRWGKLTSLRVFPSEGPLGPALAAFGEELRASLDPIAGGVGGFGVYPARALALEASVGATDFGEYFTYFSFFLVVSALLLASLFFRLGVEQRLKEIGMLRALGFPPDRIRTVFWKRGARPLGCRKRRGRRRGDRPTPTSSCTAYEPGGWMRLGPGCSRCMSRRVPCSSAWPGGCSPRLCPPR